MFACFIISIVGVELIFREAPFKEKYQCGD
jgi:hypothetical protein